MLPKGWNIIKLDNTGLSDPNDGFKTARYEYRAVKPDGIWANESFRTYGDALRYVKRYAEEIK